MQRGLPSQFSHMVSIDVPQISSMSVEELVADWMRWDKNPATREEIQELVVENETKELERRMRPRIAFGTAGLRARMEAGFSRMNQLTVIQTSQGLAQYLLDNVSGAAEAGIVIGYDGRHNSRLFAESVATSFYARGFKIWWYQKLVHTPLVPFGVQLLGAAVGVMITASHNPAEDNGYKVYGSNGCQIKSPTDTLVAASIMEDLNPVTWTDWEEAAPIWSDAFSIVVPAYFKHIRKLVSDYINVTDIPSFVYTPMHGVGLPFMESAVKLMGGHDGSHENLAVPLNKMMTIVERQASPDPNFSTVKYPNPEEKGALELAIAQAECERKRLILANDPDADRFAVAENVDGCWHQFTGDQIGVLLGHHIAQSREKVEDMTMLTSAVSSEMLTYIGKAQGFVVEETLTGFKWLGNHAKKLGPKVVFAYEEALGYMIPDVVHDKDGICAAVVFLGACSLWKSPWSKLQDLYKEYGYFETTNTYWRCTDQDLILSVFQDIRRDPSLGVKKRRLLRYRDVTYGTDSGTATGTSALPIDPNTQMVTCWLSGTEIDDGVRFTIRGSGTEPKIKIYLECRSRQQDKAREGALKALKSINDTWLRDSRLGLEQKYVLG